MAIWRVLFVAALVLLACGAPPNVTSQGACERPMTGAHFTVCDGTIRRSVDTQGSSLKVSGALRAGNVDR